MNRTKKAIIDAFWQLLEERPYSKITVQSIVECCQVNLLLSFSGYSHACRVFHSGVDGIGD